MNAGERFIDSNVLLYLISGDTTKADCAEIVLSEGGVISVQVLNEFAAVGKRRLGMAVSELREVLSTIRTFCKVVPLDVATYDLALAHTERYQLSIYDALIVAAAQLAGCETLLSEDMQDGQIFPGPTSVQIFNPFR